MQCAKDAVVLLENFGYDDPADNTTPGKSVEIVPAVTPRSGERAWYYDEATCAQLVYMYGEVGQKYKGCCSEFFSLYGKMEDGDTQPSITVGSLDIGAGTTDLMVSKYTYTKGDVTTITPDPRFYDSYYFAGDDMLQALDNQSVGQTCHDTWPGECVQEEVGGPYGQAVSSKDEGFLW